MKPENTVPAIIVSLGLIIAAMTGRYDLRYESFNFVRIDKLTGKVERCYLLQDEKPKWCPLNSN